MSKSEGTDDSGGRYDTGIEKQKIVRYSEEGEDADRKDVGASSINGSNMSSRNDGGGLQEGKSLGKCVFN